MDETLLLLEQDLSYSFNDPALLACALTHRSLINENPETGGQHNERLEFIGDAVVDLSVGHQLMERLPLAREGDLSKVRAMVVSAASLTLAAEQLNLGSYLRLGRGEEQTNGRKKSSILADAFEALVGAVYLDGGFDQAHIVVRHLLGPLIDTAVDGALHRDHKTSLQEITQAHWHQMPQYQVVAEQGPDHAKEFTVAAMLNGKELARATGPSKKAAEQRAACLALAVLQETELKQEIKGK